MRVQFVDLTLDSDSRQLVRGDAPVHLSPKAFDVLCHLIERRASAVTKDELLERTWPGTFVVEANLTGLVTEIRRALGDEAHAPRFIRTVYRHGYQFCAEVAVLRPPSPIFCAEVSDMAPPSPGTPPSPARRAWLMWNDRVLPLADGENVIGRDPSCGVWLDQPGVSRRHARIVVSDDGAAIEDLGSKNGTFVSDAAISARRELCDEDVIQLGSVDLKFKSWAQSRAIETERISRGK